MKPDRTNYETWLIDYLDGSLNNNQVNELMLFLDENPDIKDEFADVITYNLMPVTNTFKNKESIKRSASDLSDKQFEHLCIAAAEHDLSMKQIAELEAIVADNPEKRKTFHLYKKVFLVAPAVKFSNKSVLKRFTTAQKVIRLSVIGLSAAAGITLLITLYNNPGLKEGDNPLAVSENIIGDSSGKKSEEIPLLPHQGAELAADIPSSAGELKQTITVASSSSDLPDSVKNTPEELRPIQFTAEALPGADLSEGDIRAEDISKLDFKEDVYLNESVIKASLIAINTTEIPFSGTSAKPGFNDSFAKLFRQRILKNSSPESGSLKMYEIADAGIRGLNKLFGWQMSLKQNRNDKGELKSLYFSSRILKFNAPVRKVALEP